MSSTKVNVGVPRVPDRKSDLRSRRDASLCGALAYHERNDIVLVELFHNNCMLKRSQ